MREVASSYRPFLEHETRMSSVLAYLPDLEAPTLASLMPALEKLGVPANASSVKRVDGELDVLHFEVDDVVVVVRRIKALHIENHVRETMKLDKATVAALDDSRWVLVVQLKYSPMPIADLYDQVRFAYALAPQMISLLDMSAQKMRSREWVAECARAMVPPPTSALFTIHALDQPGGFWLHTHGLQRCAGLELEMHEVPAALVERAASLLNLIAPGFIERRPRPGDPFSAGELVTLCWAPWQEQTPIRDRDAEHQGPAAVLMTATRRPAFEALDAFAQSKTYPGSNMGTARDAMLAKETFTRFLALHERHQNTPGWQFEVKLSTTQARTEYRWFRFEAFRAGVIEGLAQGDRVQRPLGELADWAIGAPGGGTRPGGLAEFEAAMTGLRP